LIDVSSLGDSSKRIQDELDRVGIYVNRNAIPFDKRPPYNPSGIRLGSPAITTRGFKEKDCREVVRLIVKLIKNIGNVAVKKRIKKDVEKLLKRFPIYDEFKF